MHELDLDLELGSLHLVKFKDFFPERISTHKWTGRGEYPPISHTMAELNHWLSTHPSVELINIETVVLPNMHSKREEGSEDPELVVTTGGGYIHWNQLFRVWYVERTEDE